MCAKHAGEVDFSKKIISLLNKTRVVETASLQEIFDGRSRRSVFRDLSVIEHISSMTHAGRYITLPHIPKFDANGLWFFRDIGFSTDGSIAGAIDRIVNKSESGYTHNELNGIFHVRTHNALIELMRSKKLTRIAFGDADRYLYLSIEPLIASKQLEKRKSFPQQMTLEDYPSPLVIIQVLVEIIRADKNNVNSADIFNRLHKAGVKISVGQIENLFAKYEIGIKKTPHFR